VNIVGDHSLYLPGLHVAQTTKKESKVWVTHVTPRDWGYRKLQISPVGMFRQVRVVPMTMIFKLAAIPFFFFTAGGGRQ